jgi:hypothetical protein
MKRYRPSKILPVTQLHLSQYLKISASLMNMAEGPRRSSRKLPAGASLKLNELIRMHQEVQKTGLTGQSSEKIQSVSKKNTLKTIERLTRLIKLSDLKVSTLQYKLDEMTRREEEDHKWLNTLDHILANLSNTKGKNEGIWFKHQSVIVSERLKKYDTLAQVKLRMRVGLEKANGRIIRAMVKKLKKEMK